MSSNEIDALYERLSLVVEQTMRNVDNPDARLAPFEKCIRGRRMLTCDIYGINAFFANDAARELDRHFPGSEFYVEKTQNDKSVIRLNVPIVVVQEQQQQQQQHALSGREKKPSTNTLVVLSALWSVLSTVLYYRFVT